MRDRSKQLLVINTGKKQSEQTGMTSQSGTTHIIGGGGLSVNMSDYLLKSIWDKVFEIRTDSQGTEYIFGKLPMVTQYGITMYSGDGVNVPSLASGLPFDGRTIWYNPDTQQIEVIGGTGGGSGEGVSNFWDLSGIPSWITNSKPKYSYSEIEGTPDLTKYALASQIPSLSGYATESWVLQKNYATKATTLSGYGIKDAYTKTNVDDLLKAYVTLSGSQTITGEKNFTGGLKVNGSPIYYDTAKKYWKLEGDLLVTGGVTMYGSDSSFVPSTIMDAILYDDTTLGINSNGQLYVKGGTGGGGLDITALQNYLTQNSYLNVTGGDNRYLKLSGGMINGENDQVPLAISNTASTLRIGFVRNNEVLGYLGFIEANKPLFYDTDGNGRLLLHERNYSSYALPLTGGKIIGKLQIQRTPSNIAFYNADNVLWGHIGFNAANNAVVWDRSGANEYEILHRGNYSNYALPLSGGTLTGDLQFQENWGGMSSILRESLFPAHIYRLVWSTNGDVYDHYYNNNYSSSTYTSANLRVKVNDGYLTLRFCGDGTFTWNGNKVWHEGNDGSGSGLDADLLDGKHLSEIIRYEGYSNKNANKADTPQTITYWAENGGYGSTYGTALNIQGAGSWNNRIAFRTDGKIDYYQGINTGDMSYIGQLAFTSSNVSSATKLQTARTIWGQSFDGTGNVDGALTINKATTSSGDYGACVLINGNYAETGFHRALSYENQKMVVGSTAAMYVGAKNTQYNGGFLGFKYVSANSSSNYMSIGLYAANDLLCVLGNGNVGIGTPSPNHKLHVLGQILAQDGELISYNNINGSTAKKGGFLQLVGYYTPTSEAWPAYIASDYLGAQWCTTGGFTHGMIFKSGRSSFDNFIFLDSSGNPVARISASNTGMNHHFVGDMLVTGGITMYSDQRKKTILNHVELSLKDIANAPLIKHYYNSDDKKTTHVGSIAQYWANMNDWFCKLDSEGFYTMEIQNAALASAISIARELDRYETKTDKAIKKLKKRICELEEEVERLKSA